MRSAPKPRAEFRRGTYQVREDGGEDDYGRENDLDHLDSISAINNRDEMETYWALRIDRLLRHGSASGSRFKVFHGERKRRRT